MDFLSKVSVGKITDFVTGTHTSMDSLLNFVFGVAVALGTVWVISASIRAYRRHSYARALSKYDALGYFVCAEHCITPESHTLGM